MPTPTKPKTVQAHTLKYPEAIVWTLVPRKKTKQPNLDPDAPPTDRARNRSLLFNDLLDAKAQKFTPRHPDAALLSQSHHLHTNHDFVRPLRNRGKFYDHEESLEHGAAEHLQLQTPKSIRRNNPDVTPGWKNHYSLGQLAGWKTRPPVIGNIPGKTATN